jgi:hypothetical protein
MRRGRPEGEAPPGFHPGYDRSRRSPKGAERREGAGAERRTLVLPRFLPRPTASECARKKRGSTGTPCEVLLRPPRFPRLQTEEGNEGTARPRGAPPRQMRRAGPVSPHAAAPGSRHPCVRRTPLREPGCAIMARILEQGKNKSSGNQENTLNPRDRRDGPRWSALRPAELAFSEHCLNDPARALIQIRLQQPPIALDRDGCGTRSAGWRRFFSDCTWLPSGPISAGSVIDTAQCGSCG